MYSFTRKLNQWWQFIRFEEKILTIKRDKWLQSIYIWVESGSTGILPKELSTLLGNTAWHPIVRQSGLLFMQIMTPHSHPTLKNLQGFLFFEIHTTPLQSLQGSARSSLSLPFPPPLILSLLLMKLQQNSFQQVLGHTKLLPILGPLNLLGPLSMKLLVYLTPTYPPGLICNIISLNRLSLTTLS